LARQQKYLWFSAFPNFIKVDKFAASIERPKAKCFSFRGLRPQTLWPLPLDPAGGSAPRPPL